MSLVGTRPPTVDEWDKYELHSNLCGTDYIIRIFPKKICLEHWKTQ